MDSSCVVALSGMMVMLNGPASAITIGHLAPTLMPNFRAVSTSTSALLASTRPTTATPVATGVFLSAA